AVTRRPRALGGDHLAIGRAFLALALGFLLLGGAIAMIMRWQWAFPGAPVPLVGGLLYPEAGGAVTPAAYAGLFSSHGLLMIFFAIGPALTGLAIAIVPLAIGARATALPRASAAGLVLYVVAGALALAALAWPDVGPA